MRRLYLSIMLGIIAMGCICPRTYHGYGRYVLRLDCDKVVIDDVTYMVRLDDNRLIVQDHTIGRGINRKYRPWLYVHKYDDDKIDVTFDTGAKPEYPLYIGVSRTIGLSYDNNVKVDRSTNIECKDNRWLISHRWTDSGFYFDIQERVDESMEAWSHLGEVFVSTDGSYTTIPIVDAKVKIVAFDAQEKRAEIVFNTLP